MILLDSLYINNSGGKVLLDYLINTIISSGQTNRFHFLLDKRGVYNYLEKISYEFGEPSELFRYKFYKKNKNKFSKVFCFGNVPPPLKLKCTVFVYFHNVLLAESLNNYPLKSRISKFLKRQYIKFFISNVDEIMVQTAYVREKFNLNINNSIKVSLLPFYNLQEVKFKKNTNGFEFVYVSNGNPHKNHHFLLDVWGKLSALNYYPILNLTITDNYGNLIERINKLNKAGVKVRNFGFTNINELFSHSTHLIYPSLKESFGLGLVEGVHSGLKIIGADLPYTYEVVKPSLTFSPYNSDDLVSKLIRVLDNEISMEDSEIVVENRINQLLKNLLK